MNIEKDLVRMHLELCRIAAKVNTMLIRRKLGALRYEAGRLRKVADKMDQLSNQREKTK